MTEFDELAEVPVRSEKARQLPRQNDADFAHGDGAEELLETLALRCGHGRTRTKVHVDDFDDSEPEFSCSICHRVLQALALQVVADLLLARLPEVDDGFASKMLLRDLLLRAHRPPPELGVPV